MPSEDDTGTKILNPDPALTNGRVGDISDEARTEAAKRAEDHSEHPAVKTVDQWLRDCIHGSVVAQNTDVYNHLVKSLDELKKRLVG